MKRLSIYFLAFLTFWMSTWMVTDIHDLSIDNAAQLQRVHSVQQSHIDSDQHIAATDEHRHNSHCGVCSYDHGGHIGQTLTTSSYVAESFPAQSTINRVQHSDFWYSRNTSPMLRPPIA